MTPGQVREWARAEAARQNLAELARLVAPTKLMPLKGVELVFRYGVPAAERPMLDFDVLAPAGTFRDVTTKMETAGYRTIAPNFSARVLMSRRGFMPVDVHRMALPPMMGRLSSKRLFGRADESSAVYGVPIAHARPQDFFVLLLANALKDQLPRARASTILRDLDAVATQTTPHAVADASHDARLSVAAWIVMQWLEASVPGFGLARFRNALEPSRGDRLRAQVSLTMVPRLRERHPEVAYALARSNTDELWRGGLSAGLSFARAARDRIRNGYRNAHASGT